MNRLIKNLLFIGVLVIIISSLAAVMALGESDDGTVSIMNEEVELVEITPGNHAAIDITDTDSEGNKKLTFNFDKGLEGEYGFQPGSYYTWEKLFKITNKTAQPLNVRVEFDASNKDWIDSNLGLRTKIGSGDLQTITDDNKEFVVNALASNEGTWIDLTIAIPKILQSDTLKELGKGYSNQEISGKLFITEYTVKKHVSQILSKLEVTDRTNAALYANSKGLVTYAVH